MTAEVANGDSTRRAEGSEERAEFFASVNGDHLALTALWNRHRRWVAAVLLAHKPAHAELDDLLQEVVMSVIRNIHTVRDSRSIRPWLRTVAINTARLAARTANARPKLRLVGESFDLQPAQDSGDGNGAPLDEAHAVLREVLALPEMYREPLLLRAVHGMSYERMAETLGLTVEAIESRIVRARRMVRERATGDGQAAHTASVPS
jgi:RNA polymerase sigma factor (sigma-70 family)